MAPGEAPRATPGAPVVLIVLDALDAGHVSHLGYERETTPHLDALAADGLSFTSALAPAPYTLASIPSLLTGRLPDAHGLVRKSRWLVPEETTVAEVFGAAGYRTFAAVANPNGSSLYGLEQGFDAFVEPFRPGAPDVASVPAEEVPRDELVLPEAGAFVPILEDWIGRVEDGEPFLFYLHLLEPHSPYAPPEPFRSRWLDPAYEGPLAQGDSETLIAANRGAFEVEPEDVEAARALYDATLAYADDVVGRMMERLRAAGLYERSLVVVTSDHGEAFWQHGRWGHNDQLFEEMVRVPLVVKPPAGALGRPGSRVDGLASIVDVLPSVCDWAGLAAPPGLDGRALNGLWTDPGAFEERGLYLRTNADFPTLGLRTPGSKTIVQRERGGGRVLGIHHYDLERDPDESLPLEDAEIEGGAERSEDVLRWARRMWEADQSRRQAVRESLSEGERDLLRSLGYDE